MKESINQIGRKAFRYILQNYFALKPNESRKFVELIEDMNYFAPGYDTIPEDWYFDKIEPMPNKEGILLERINETYFQQLFEERENIRQTIKNFRKLPEELQEIAIKEWPEELHKPLKKQLVGFKGPKVIANHIIAIRWGIKEDAVERNIKRLKKKKRNNRSKN